MQESTGYTLHRLVFGLDRAADALLREEFGISYNRAVALALLKEKSGITQHELAQMLGRTDAAVSILLADLTEDGYTLVRVSPDHKRKNVVLLSAKGEKLAGEVGTYLEKKFQGLVEKAGIDHEAYAQMTERLYQAHLHYIEGEK